MMTLNAIQDGALIAGKFVWNDDCPAWPVHLDAWPAIPGTKAYVTAPVLLAMVKAVAINRVNGGGPFVDEEDAVEQVGSIARSQRAWYEGRLVYDVSGFVVNTGSMEPDIVAAAGFEDLDDPDAEYQS